jgi:LPXTG-site transpeptidase (sortase) family protein
LDSAWNVYVSGHSDSSWGAPVRPYSFTKRYDGLAARLVNDISPPEPPSPEPLSPEPAVVEEDTCPFEVGSAGGTFEVNGGAVITIAPGTIPDGSCLTVNLTAFPPPVNDIWALGGVVDVTIVGPDGSPITSFNPPLELCMPYTAGDVAKVGGNPSNLKMGYAQNLGDPWLLMSTTVNTTDMMACIKISHLTIFGLFEPLLPQTGFTPGVQTALTEQTADYIDLSPTASDALKLEIPRLGETMPIMGVPESGDGWDVTWLGGAAGWLNGTAYPTWAGNTALTAHVYNAEGQAGPFKMLHTLWWGDQIIIHNAGLAYIYEVRSAVTTTPDNLRVLKHEELDWITLVTCRGYNAVNGGYDWRTVVRAVLVDVK